jgi:hypothetical protein
MNQSVRFKAKRAINRINRHTCGRELKNLSTKSRPVSEVVLYHPFALTRLAGYDVSEPHVRLHSRNAALNAGYKTKPHRLKRRPYLRR